jgi:hypothetical protein
VKPIGPGDLSLSGLAALIAGLGLWKLWWWAGYPAAVFTPGLDGFGPDAMAWPRLLAVWVPAGHVLFALAYAGLARRDSSPALRRHFVADQWTLALALPLGAALLAWRGHGFWRPAIAAWYTGFVAVKTAILLHALVRWLPGASPSSRRAGLALFLAAFLPYACLGGLVTTAMSTAGDEPYYLLIAHSLLRDGDQDLANNLTQRDYLPFYWGELARTGRVLRVTPEGSVYAPLYQGLEPFLLLPGYWAAGRLGAVLTTSALAAVTLLMVFRLALEIGATFRAGFLAWMGLAFSAPFLSFAASPFPEAAAAFFTTASAWLLTRERARWTARGAAAVCLVALMAIKIRFLLLIPPLVAASVRRIRWQTLVALIGGLALALFVANSYDVIFMGGSLARRAGTASFTATLRWLVTWTVRAPGEMRGHLGLLWDQEFGLLLTAPVFLLSVAGLVVAAAERRGRVLLLLAGPFGLAWYYLGAVGAIGIAFQGASLWYAGFSPPARFLIAPLPLFAVLIALAVDRLRHRVAWSVAAALYAVTLGYAALLSAWPAWRFQSGLGRASVLLEIFRRLGVDLGRLLPTFMRPESGWTGIAWGALGLALLGGAWLARRPGAPPPRGALLAGAAGVTLGLGAWWAAALWHPTGAYPALLGTGTGGLPFLGSLDLDADDGTVVSRERLVWAGQRNGVLDLAPRLGPGHYRVAVVAGAQGADGRPSLSVRLGAEPPLEVALDSAPPPRWRERAYTFDVRWPGGRLPIRLELGALSRRDPIQLAYLDRIDIQRIEPDGAPGARP